MTLFTGGKAVPGRKSLFVISGWACELLDKRASAPYALVNPDGSIDYPYPSQPLPSESVIIPGLGP